MKYKDFTIHICLFAAFAFQLVFMLSDLSEYGFLTYGYLTISDILIVVRFVVFLPLSVYEAYLSAKCKREADEDDGTSRHHHRRHKRGLMYKITHFGKPKHSSQHHRRAYIKDSDGNVMDEEYSKRTQFMDKEALLKKQEEMRKSRVH
ncbi:hypothetical protein H8706_07095 [Oscillospiraceae bacterium NSJ-50]|uniref:Uncharacterized protein n=2 Tax=Qingrenia yutianensis TaxID=2763676 RepID=A0A926FE79_9FIRM|nr:hypothetical protein [Qingrenia yutianensis]